MSPAEKLVLSSAVVFCFAVLCNREDETEAIDIAIAFIGLSSLVSTVVGISWWIWE